MIAVQVADSVPSGKNINPAMIGADYSLAPLGTASLSLVFLPTMQRFNIPFTLLNDTFLKEQKLFV